MPTLLLDKQKCLYNIAAMASKANRHQLSFRPHCKTHQSATIASWYREFGVDSITVSSFEMALYFARHGWKDILVAFPFNPSDLDILQELSGKIQIAVLIDNPEALPFFNRIEDPVDFYIDIDTGYGRTGIPAGDEESIDHVIRAGRAQKHLNFKGFYCHAGHSYKAGTAEARQAIHQRAQVELEGLKASFGRLQCRVLYGDTPNCSTMDDFSSMDEITPGNFVFYDLFQLALGSCKPEQVAVAMACPVTGKYSGEKLLVHGGAVHFSKESLDAGGKEMYGQVVHPGVRGWGKKYEGAYITSLSQEHGILEDCGPLYNRTSIGDQILVLPVHSCLTANLMKSYRTIGGEHIETMHS